MEFLASPDATWGTLRKILFRFVFVYIVVYALSHPFGAPFGETIEEYYNLLWDAPVLWVGQAVFGVEITVRPAGSGDTTFNYVQVFAMLVFSLVLCLVWTVLDRKRRNYDALLDGLVVFVRYYVAFVMLTYGFVKVFKQQFPFPFQSTLVQSYGDSSPMKLLWTFMGFSKSYTIFSGLCEVVGGLLLFFRRTTTLGALVVVGVMSNVAMLNFSYDVPVKLFSVHLLLLAVFLVAIDLRRVLHVFVLNRPAASADLASPVASSMLRKIGLGLKVLVIGYVLFTQVSDRLETEKLYGDSREKPPLYGLYEVDTFVHNGDTLAPLLTDAARWRRLIVDWPGSAAVQQMNEQVQHYGFRPDTAAQTLTLFTFADTTQQFTLRYHQPAPEQLRITGVLQADTLAIDLSRRDASAFQLINRGFHWISEFPYNR